ncbi:MAG: DUF4150 domain-containing protein [Desulfobacteraceae bacterium]|nr:DUF4150 domain-containing protein [Desulfobacteraceae bacterium]
MFPGSTKGGGNCLAAPDVCITQVPPPVVKSPIPYPNTAMLMQATKTSTKVKFVSKEVVTLKSEIPKSMGDEAGTDKGVMSGTTMDKVVFKKGSSKVKVEGQPCVYLTSVSAHNGSNANAPAGAQIAPSQTKVLVGM